MVTNNDTVEVRLLRNVRGPCRRTLQRLSAVLRHGLRLLRVFNAGGTSTSALIICVPPRSIEFSSMRAAVMATLLSAFMIAPTLREFALSIALLGGMWAYMLMVFAVLLEREARLHRRYEIELAGRVHLDTKAGSFPPIDWPSISTNLTREWLGRVYRLFTTTLGRCSAWTSRSTGPARSMREGKVEYLALKKKLLQIMTSTFDSNLTREREADRARVLFAGL